MAATATIRRLDHGFLSINDTVTALGQNVFDNNLTIYAYLEITEASGRRVLIDKVAVSNDMASLLQLGSVGEFFFNKMFGYGRRFHCQIWEIKSETTAVLDRDNVRKMVAAHYFVVGSFLLPFGGLGAFWLLPSVWSLTMLSGGVNRDWLFYGTNPAEVRRLRQQQAVRI